jgi:hypothetical protein
VDFAFTGPLVYWRGPAPWHFVAVPEAQCGPIEASASEASYGWGCIPVSATIGSTEFTTSLFPKDGGYLLPVKAAVRRAEGLDLGDVVDARMTIDV